MDTLNTITVTKIERPFFVFSEAGKEHQMADRRCFGLSFCQSGKITYCMNGKEFISDPSHAVLLPQGGTYLLKREEEGIFPVLNFLCDGLALDEIRSIPLANPEACLKACDKMQELFLFKKSRYRVYSCFYEILDMVFGSATQESHPLMGVIEYIEKNISDPLLSNGQLARQIGFSEVYLRKLFSKHYNTTPKQYILDIRLQKAKQLLTDTPFSVTAIAEECGFSSVFHFCRAFKQKVGMTPTEFSNLYRIREI